MTDPTTPTPDEIARWTALAEGATPGPWVTETTDDGQYTMILFPINDRATYPARSLSGNFGQIVAWTHDEPDAGPDEVAADAEFIAAAREAVPRLLALVAAQAEQIAEWEGGVAVTRSRLLAAELDAGLVIEASRTRADKAEAELAALHATDDYQRWARVVVERDAAREQVARVRALCEAADKRAQEFLGPRYVNVGRLDVADVRAALDPEPPR